MYTKHKMYKGGSSYTPRSAEIIRYAGLIIPAALIFYGLAVQLGYVEGGHQVNIIAFSLVSFWWLYMGVVQFFAPSKTRLDSALRLVAYHLLAGSYLIFISGIATPLIVFWIVLLLASNTYFSKNGLNASILSFILIVGIDIILWNNSSNNEVMTYDLVALVAIILSGLVVMSIERSQQVDRLALTKSKQKEVLQRDRTLTIVNNLTDAILSTDKNGVIRVYNAASLNLLDTNENLNGQHIDDILKLVDQADAPVSIFTEFSKSRATVTRDDLNYSFKDGEEIRLEITYSPIRRTYSKTKNAETNDGYIIIMRDITKAKSLEEERDEFISVASHELRTPITIMEGALSNIQVMMAHPDVTQTMITDSVTMAHDQSLYLAKMVNDLSTLSRAERGVADKPELIDVRELIQKLHEEYNKSAVDRHLHLDLDLGTTLGHIEASRLYVEELLQNIITNAIKYTKQGGVKVSVKNKAGIITFTIKDTGIGISKSDQNKIFHKFYRSEDYRTRETNGTGLGLYVAAKLAHKLGTKIEFASRLNHGSTFSFQMSAVSKK